MMVFLNGSLVPEEEARISIFDRGFLYGDGLFETILVANGKPFRWEQHLRRFRQGAEFLRIHLPFSDEHWLNSALGLVQVNRLPNALLRLTVSRGVGLRGYSPRGAQKPTMTMSLHPFSAGRDGEVAPQWRLISASFRLPAKEPLAQFKTCNKLPQILARAEADDWDCDEALLLNTDGFVVEGASSNLFWLEDGAICTPPLAAGILAGITRSVILEIASSTGLAVREKLIRPRELHGAGGVFVSLSSWGIVEAVSLDGHALSRSPVVEILRKAFWSAVKTETGV